MLARHKSTLVVKKDYEVPWEEQRECLLSLLHGRALLRRMAAQRLREERVRGGLLSANEIIELLSSQDQENDVDFVTQISEKTRNLLQETRHMRELEHEVEKLDKKISLLVKNAGQVSAMKHYAPPSRTAASTGAEAAKISDQKMTLYSNLFYLLQTEPEYIANIMDVLEDRYNPQELNEMTETILLALYGDAFSPREEFLLLKVFKLFIDSAFQRTEKLMDFVERKAIAPMVLTYVKYYYLLLFIYFSFVIIYLIFNIDDIYFSIYLFLLF